MVSARAAGLPIVLCLTALCVEADVYLQNPRGSNDRNCERNVNRNNGNRLFDSQNNAKGGYACPRAVGAEAVQDEDGMASFGTFKQSKRPYYYEGSYLPIEWTNQHGCGANSKVNCEIILQYMCEDTADPKVDNFWPWTPNKDGHSNSVGAQAFRSEGHIATPRDGIPTSTADAATETIPDKLDAAVPDSEDNRRYGMHESHDHYKLCQYSERNKGLYTADQRVRRTDQRGTRQNPNGNRRGLECPEERDYYPWWHPSPWIDVAVLTNDAGDNVCDDPADVGCSARCKYYLENSFNKNKKGYCDDNHAAEKSTKTDSQAWKQRKWHNNRDACEAAGYVWHEVALSDVLDVPYPKCAKTAFARANHLGNADDATIPAPTASDSVPSGVNANRYLWQIPSIPTPTSSEYFGSMDEAYRSCTLRIRYNISTSDFPAWPSEALEVDHPFRGLMVDHNNNSANHHHGHTPNGESTPLLQDPYMSVGVGDADGLDDQIVSLAVNTNQYARTFQDRTFKFQIRKRPTTASAANDQTDTPAVPAVPSDANIYNVNVRGKRGNIVQTYPAVEYDFVPNSLATEQGDLVHFQWEGSDYNPRRGCNDAEGGPPDPNDFVSGGKKNARADRSNAVFLSSMAMNTPMDYGAPSAAGDFSAREASMKAALAGSVPCDMSNDGSCFDSITRLAYLNQQSDKGSLELRRGLACLTQTELDNVGNKQERETHPLNCAKLNAKPYPYFDGGLMKMSTVGKHPFFSSRNNNFSNRDQTGIVCVKGNGETCTPDTATGVLGDTNPAIGTATQRYRTTRMRMTRSACEDEASANSGRANDQGAASCITAAEEDLEDEILNDETMTIEQAANDAIGDGDDKPCEEITWFLSPKWYFILLLVLTGGVAAWGGTFAYNRVKLRRRKANDERFLKKSWKAQTVELSSGATGTKENQAVWDNREMI